jgi:hypothetical protein
MSRSASSAALSRRDFANRIAALPRALLFIGGDIHAGAIFDITNDGQPDGSAPCLISSGISKQAGRAFLLNTIVDQDFQVAPGIRTVLRQLVNGYNFGIVETVPTAGTPVVVPTVAHSGATSAWGAQISLPI